MFGLFKRKNEEILHKYRRIKKSEFNFERISLLYSAQNHEDTLQVVSYRTLQDLDFEELFMFLDRTCSKIGQQKLYSILRTIPRTNDRAQRYEEIITQLEGDDNKKEHTVLALSNLNQSGAYFLQRLIYGENLVKPKWFWILQTLSTLTLLSFVLVFPFPHIFIPIIIPLAIINFIFHYWNKKNILTYSNAIPQLTLLHQTGKQLLSQEAIFLNRDQFNSSIKSIKSLANKVVWFKFEKDNSNELAQIGEYLLELIKSIFLIEPILIFQFIKGLESKQEDIKTVFHAIAEIDVALSIHSVRESLPYYSLPDIKDGIDLKADSIFHPLIIDPIANDLDLSDGKSMLITGSNMSGKTTFIRTIGINVLMAQTINTACAKRFIIPKIQIHSAIKIADNLLDDTSYYYEEVKILKNIIEASESEYHNLILLDELFKGTNTVERVSSGKAVLSHLNDNDNYVLVTTHDLELTELLKGEYTTYHFPESIKNNQLSFSYKLENGKSVNTNAIKILEINGFPRALTNDAKDLAKNLLKLKNDD